MKATMSWTAALMTTSCGASREMTSCAVVQVSIDSTAAPATTCSTAALVMTTCRVLMASTFISLARILEATISTHWAGRFLSVQWLAASLGWAVA
ncbi:hypothetical protein N799_10340 [Lysobacter arseniciresistens ZS79]|uniref:Uncharacterized protein n=1 Tax=Lysobacter arseniciresistens ZS79 TaxID=913325 RepID=A0A0A0F778_9GAMM|nr:hypothetical protein N799_10340 [Lysobacter arseniciresistens ZS79]